MTHLMSNYTAPESILVGTLHQMPSQMEQWYLEERLADDGIDWDFKSEMVVFRGPIGDVQGRFVWGGVKSSTARWFWNWVGSRLSESPKRRTQTYGNEV